ncbi:TRAP transporter substrate-binding protein [Marinococcus halophilus]
MESGRGLQGYNAGKFPVSAVMEMPFLAQGSAEEMSITFQQLYEEFPAIQEEYEGTKPLWLHTSDAYAIITKDEKVENFEDVKGMKIRSPSVQTSNMIESWGATSVSLPAPDIYDSMQKGVIDGAIIPVTAIEDFNLYDVVDYVTIGDFNTALFYVTMNKESWNEIPNQDQKIIEQELLGEPMASLAGQKFDELEQETEVEAKEQGIEFYELPEEEINKFENASENVTQNWIEDMESQGVEGQKIYNRAEELMTDNDK